MSILSREVQPDGSKALVIDFKAIIRVLFRNCFIILLIAILCAWAGFLYSTREMLPQYTSHFTAYISNKADLNKIDNVTINDTTAREALTNAYAELLQSRNIVERALERSGLSFTYEQAGSTVSASAEKESQTVSVSVTMSSPVNAYLLAKAIADDAPSYITELIGGSHMIVIDTPLVPVWRTSPDVKKIVIMSGAAGSFLGSLLLLFIYAAAETIRKKTNYFMEEMYEVRKT